MNYKEIEVPEKTLLSGTEPIKSAKISGRLFNKLASLKSKMIDKKLSNIEDAIDHMPEYSIPEFAMDNIKNSIKKQLEKLNAKTINLSKSKFTTDDLVRKIKLTQQRITTLKAKCKDITYSMSDDDLSSAIEENKNKDMVDVYSNSGAQDDDLATAINRPIVTPPLVKENKDEVEKLNPVDGEYHFNKEELANRSKEEFVNNNKEEDKSEFVRKEVVSFDDLFKGKPTPGKVGYADFKLTDEGKELAQKNREHAEELRQKYGVPDDLDVLKKATRAAVREYLEQKKEQIKQVSSDEQITKEDNADKYRSLYEPINSVDDAYEWLKNNGKLDENKSVEMENPVVDNKPSYWDQVEMVAHANDRANDLVSTKEVTVDEYQPDVKTNDSNNIEINDVDSAYEWLKQSGKLDDKTPEVTQNVESHPSYMDQVEMVAHANDRTNDSELIKETTIESKPVETTNYEYGTKVNADEEAYADMLKGLTDKYISGNMSADEAKENFGILVEMLETSKKQRQQEFGIGEEQAAPRR